MAQTNYVMGLTDNTGSEVQNLITPGASGTLLQSTGTSTAANFTTSTYPVTNAANTLLYASSANTMAALATANNGTLITSGAGVPSISSTLPAAVQGNITNIANGTSLGTSTCTLYSTAVLPLSNAQIKGMFVTPVQLIGAPSSGQVIVPVMVIIKLLYGGNNAFTGGGNILLVDSGGEQLTTVIPATAFTATTNSYCLKPAQSVVCTQANYQTSAVSITNQTGAFTGNAANDNTAEVQVFYYILTM